MESKKFGFYWPNINSDNRGRFTTQIINIYCFLKQWLHDFRQRQTKAGSSLKPVTDNLAG